MNGIQHLLEAAAPEAECLEHLSGVGGVALLQLPLHPLGDPGLDPLGHRLRQVVGGPGGAPQGHQNNHEARQAFQQATPGAQPSGGHQRGQHQNIGKQGHRHFSFRGQGRNTLAAAEPASTAEPSPRMRTSPALLTP